MLFFSGADLRSSISTAILLWELLTASDQVPETMQMLPAGLRRKVTMVIADTWRFVWASLRQTG